MFDKEKDLKQINTIILFYYDLNFDLLAVGGGGIPSVRAFAIS